MIGSGRHVTISVLTLVGLVCLALIFVISTVIVDGAPRLYDRLRGHVVPSRDVGLAGAVPTGNPGALFSADDYPAEALRRNEQGRTVAALRIDAAGWPTGCSVAVSSGSASLDDMTCRIGLRARFSSARDATGRAIAGTYRLPVRWVLPQAEDRPVAIAGRPAPKPLHPPR